MLIDAWPAPRSPPPAAALPYGSTVCKAAGLLSLDAATTQPKQRLLALCTLADVEKVAPRMTRCNRPVGQHSCTFAEPTQPVRPDRAHARRRRPTLGRFSVAAKRGSGRAGCPARATHQRNGVAVAAEVLQNHAATPRASPASGMSCRPALLRSVAPIWCAAKVGTAHPVLGARSLHCNAFCGCQGVTTYSPGSLGKTVRVLRACEHRIAGS